MITETSDAALLIEMLSHDLTGEAEATCLLILALLEQMEPGVIRRAACKAALRDAPMPMLLDEVRRRGVGEA